MDVDNSTAMKPKAVNGITPGLVLDEVTARVNHGDLKPKAVNHIITPGLVLDEVTSGVKLGHLTTEELLQAEANYRLLEQQKATMEAWINQRKSEEAAREQIEHEKERQLRVIAAGLAAQEEHLLEQQKVQLDMKLQAEQEHGQREQILRAQAQYMQAQEQALQAAQEKQHAQEKVLQEAHEKQHAQEQVLRASKEEALKESLAKQHVQEQALRAAQEQQLRLQQQEEKQAEEKNLLEQRNEALRALEQRSEKQVKLYDAAKVRFQGKYLSPVLSAHEAPKEIDSIMNHEPSYGTPSNFSQSFTSPTTMPPIPGNGKKGEISKKIIDANNVAAGDTEEASEEMDSIMTREPSFGSESNFSQFYMSPTGTTTSASPGKGKKSIYAKRVISSTDRKTRSATKKALENKKNKSTSTLNQVIAGAQSIINSTFYNNGQDDISEIGKGEDEYNGDETSMATADDGGMKTVNDLDGHENLWYFTPPSTTSTKIKKDSTGRPRIRGPGKNLFSNIPKSKDPKYFGELIPDHEVVQGDEEELLGKRHRLESKSVYGPNEDSKQKDV